MTLLGDHAPFYDLLIHVSLIVALGTYTTHTLGRNLLILGLYLSSGGFKQYHFKFINKLCYASNCIRRFYVYYLFLPFKVKYHINIGS